MLEDLSTAALVGALGVAAAVVFAAGVKITRLADVLADRTGLGEALAGAVLLGAATSLSGVVVSIVSAIEGRPSLAFSNSIGGIAAQTAFLAIADLTYRKANLEHAAAELANIFQALVLVVLLALPFLAFTLPEATLWAVHPVSLVIPALYVGSLIASRAVREAPMWRAVSTAETRDDAPEDESAATRRQSTARLVAVFLGLMAAMGAAGWAIAVSAGELSGRLGVSETLLGVLATAVITSLPELVTTLIAIRRGALQLAVGGIIGGNTFDTLFLSAADVAYRDGSLYHAVQLQDYFWVVTALLMTCVVTGGLIVREREGPGRIGLESVTLLTLYAGAVAAQVLLEG
ncbi:MAG: sodium:calcium antiporter [Marivibrio sp.]|uniref:sodium:calcium antiporter n=1 Tax=Marivibrio sp. TaxID=2039719 RepID=UPI0032EB0441